MSALIKICGLNSEAAINAVIKSGAEYAGFVHYLRSPRHVSVARAAELKALLPASIKSVMVLVNPSDELLAEVATIMQPDFFQLHGDETPQRIKEIRKNFPKTGVIKAISVSNSHDVKKAKDYHDIADFIMFDAKTPGSGITFDWSLLTGNTPVKNWILSGGLNAGNVKQSIRQTGAGFVDVSSGVETAPGAKDAGLIETFVKAVREP